MRKAPPEQICLAWPIAGVVEWVFDRGYGEQAPTADSNGVVFNYFYILAAYTEALFIFLAVAASLFPDFAQRFAEKVLRPVRFNFSTSASNSRRREIFDYVPNILPCVPDCPALAARNRHWEKSRSFAAAFLKCRWKVPGGRRILHQRRACDVRR